MTFLTVDVADQDTLDANGVSESLNEVFTVAILLTGNADRAERTVLEGIETLDRGPAPRVPVFISSNYQSRDHISNDARRGRSSGTSIGRVVAPD